jgi:hypothetical protein
MIKIVFELALLMLTLSGIYMFLAVIAIMVEG